MSFDKSKLNVINNFFKSSFISYLNQKFKTEIKTLKKDYKSIDVDKHLIKENLIARSLSYRVFDNKLKNFLEKKINICLNKKITKDKFILNPVVYYRSCKPEGISTIKYKRSKLYTEPHYDKSIDNNKFFSIWIPLKKTNFETGTLCYFDIPDILRKKEFPISDKNKFSFYNYFKNPEPVDKLLSNYVNTVYLDAGDIIFFNGNCLHGATKPISRERLSINFKVFNSKILKSKNKFEKNKFLLSNHSIDICNFINLLSIRDYIGAKRVYKKIGKIKLNQISKFLEKKTLKELKKFMNGQLSYKNYFKNNYKKNLHYSKELSILKS